MPPTLTSHSYGKSSVRLTRVVRHPDRHEIREVAVDIRLEGDFDTSYTAGDNSRIVATDTMKNVVYALAADRPAEPIEAFGAALADHFVGRFPHVRACQVTLREAPWHRIPFHGTPHPHAFVGGGPARRVAVVERTRGATRFEAGIEGLMVLKTARSGFVGFLRDEFTTLPETTDRILATEVQARWTYDDGADPGWAFDLFHAEVEVVLLQTFAEHDSRAVQETLFAMGEAALAICPGIAEITLTLPNQHRIPVDLARLGGENRNEVFVPTDEPFGLITGTLRRG